MARGAKAKEKNHSKNGANLGFEQKLWQAADKLRGNMDAADYKNVVLGLALTFPTDIPVPSIMSHAISASASLSYSLRLPAMPQLSGDRAPHHLSAR